MQQITHIQKEYQV